MKNFIKQFVASMFAKRTPLTKWEQLEDNRAKAENASFKAHLERIGAQH